jgi:hypothetical protein
MAEQSGDAAEIGRRAAEAAIGTARRGGRRLGEEMRDAAAALAAEQQAQLAETVHGFALAFRRTADALREEQSPVASRCAGQAAAQLDRAAAALRERTVAEMLAEAEALARRQPALFIAGSVAAGFLAARLLAASAARPDRRGDHPWQEGPQPADEALAGAEAGRW